MRRYQRPVVGEEVVMDRGRLLILDLERAIADERAEQLRLPTGMALALSIEYEHWTLAQLWAMRRRVYSKERQRMDPDYVQAEIDEPDERPDPEERRRCRQDRRYEELTEMTEAEATRLGCREEWRSVNHWRPRRPWAVSKGKKRTDTPF